MEPYVDFTEKTIKDIRINPGSGLACLMFEDGSDVMVESGFGVRCLVRVFGSLEEMVGQTIQYTTDSVGILEGFVPMDLLDDLEVF